MMENEDKKFRLAAMCIFCHDGKILLSKHLDNAKNEQFYRYLGGGMDFWETSENAVRREIKEELLSDIDNLKLIKVIENIFTYEGIKRHEIDFLYYGDLARKELYDLPKIHVIEKTYEFDAGWIPVQDIFSGSIPLYPEFDYKALFSEHGFV